MSKRRHAKEKADKAAAAAAAGADDDKRSGWKKLSAITRVCQQQKLLFYCIVSLD